MIRHLAPFAATVALLSLGAAAQAQEAPQQAWGVNDTPEMLEGFGQACMLWYGRTQPMLQLQVRNDRRLLILSAPEFTDARAGEIATMRFPLGFEAGVPIVNTDGEGAVLVRLSPASVDTLLENLSSPGIFRVTISERSVSFPVPDLSAAITHLRGCESQLTAS